MEDTLGKVQSLEWLENYFGQFSTLFKQIWKHVFYLFSKTLLGNKLVELHSTSPGGINLLMCIFCYSGVIQAIVRKTVF